MMKKSLVQPIMLVLTLCLVLSFCACQKAEEPQNSLETLTVEKTNPAPSSLWEGALYREDREFGSGAKKVLVVVKAEEKEVTFTLHTDQNTLAEALLEHNLAEGEEGAYGLYIKKVNGIKAVFEEDKTYWSLSKNGEMLMTGASETTVSDGERYELTRTKG